MTVVFLALLIEVIARLEKGKMTNDE